MAAERSPEHNEEGERRQVTVLFADIVGFTAFSEKFGEEATYTLMQRVSALMTDVVHGQGGAVGSFTGDGIMALFGVPVALEDAPIRACRTALLIQQHLASASSDIESKYGMNPQVRIGINTGLVIVGRMQSGDSTAMTALGDAVNLASRLQSIAEPGGVLLSEATYRMVQAFVESRSAGEHTIKGKAEPQRVYRLDGIRGGATRFDMALSRNLTNYVGRTRDLEILERCLNEPAPGVRVIDIVGEPGIGKSRLLHELRKRIANKRVFAIVGSCSPDGQQTPFLPFIELVRGSFRLSIGEAETEIARKLEKGLTALGLQSDQNLGLLFNLLGLKAPDGALNGLDSVLIGLRTRDLLLSLLQEQCRIMPVVTLLEDLHWIDNASEELVGTIIENGKSLPLKLLHTRRPEYRPPWREEPCVISMSLDPLSKMETQQIVRARLDLDELPDSLGQLIAERADGNALFAEEIANFLIERGMVRRAGINVEFNTEAVAAALPPTVRSVLAARIDRLSAEDRELLQVASVIGRRFDAILLAEAANISGELESRLNAMQALDLVHRNDESQDYAFKHALLRDVLYEGLLSARRSAVHLRVAGGIERRSGNRLAEVAEVLAHHYCHTSHAEKAFSYLALAGRKSLDTYSMDEANHYFWRALSLFESSPHAASDKALADLIVNLLQTLALRGEYSESKRVAERYLSRLEAMGDSVQFVIACGVYGTVLNNSCDFQEAEVISKRALEMAERMGDAKSLAYARIPLMFASVILGRYSVDAAKEMGLQLLADSKRSNDNWAQNYAHFLAGWDSVTRGLMNDARHWAWKLLAAGRERRDRRAIGMGYAMLTWINIGDARYSEALANSDECLKAAVTPLDRIGAAGGKATAMTLEGAVQEGLPQLLETRQRAREKGWFWFARTLDTSAGAGLVLSGRIREGIRLLKQVILASDADGDGIRATWGRIILAEVYLGMLAGERTTPPLTVILSNLDVILAARLFGATRALALLEQAGRNDQLHEYGTIRARINMDIGMLHKLKTRPALARQFLEKARAPAELQGATFMVEKIDGALASL
jgi:class 3 adenylate cyclase